MLDAKILAAVLASLTAVAVGFDGGSVDATSMDSDAVESKIEVPEAVQEVTKPIQRFRDMLNAKPEPENEVNMVLEMKDMENEAFDLEEASLEVENFTSISMDGKNFTSDETIHLHGFSGSIQPGEQTSLTGSTAKFTSSGVNVSGITAVEETVHTEKLRVTGINKASISLSSVEGRIDSEDASTEFTDSSRPLNINSFSGSIQIYTNNSTAVIDGKVDRLESGAFSFGG